MTRRRFLIAVPALLACALALRSLHAASRESVWGDEAQHLGVLSDWLDGEGLGPLLEREGHPPLPYLLDKAAAWVAGGLHPAALRVLPVLFGTLAVGCVVLLAAGAFDRKTALVAGIWAAVCPVHVYYSGEIRCYALSGLLAGLHALALLAFLRSNNARRAVLWGATTAAMAYTHYYGFFAAAAGGVFALAQRRTRTRLLHVALAAGTGIVLLLPWIPTLLAQLSHDLQPWYAPRRNPRDLLMTARLALGESGTWAALALLATGAAFLRKAPERERTAFAALLALSLGAGALAYLVQLWRAPLEPRYLLAMLVPLFPVLALGPARLAGLESALAWRSWRLTPRGGRRAAVALLVLAVALQLTGHQQWLQRRTSAAAGVAAVLAEQGRPGDTVWFAAPFLALPVAYHYDGDLPLVAPPYAPPPRHLDWVDVVSRLDDSRVQGRFLADLEGRLREGGRIWLVAWGHDDLGRDWAFDTRQDGWGKPPLLRAEHQLLRRVLRLLYRHAEDVYHREAPLHEYRESISLLLFDPAAKR